MINLIQQLKRNYLQVPSWLKWVGLAVVIMLASAFLLNIITPPATPTPTVSLVKKNYNGSASHFKKVKFTGKPPVLPHTLTTYYGQAESVAETIKLIKQEFKLSQTDQNLWQGPDYSLVYVNDAELFSLSLNQTDETDLSLPAIDQHHAISLAQELVNKLFPKEKTNLSLAVAKINYLSGFPELKAVPSNQATHMMLPFSYKLDYNLPVFISYDQYLPVKFLIDSNLKLKKLEFKDRLFSFRPKTKLKTVSITQAINNINHGIGTVIEATANDLEPLDLSNITQATLNKAELEYRVDPNQNNFTLPFYHFYGMAKNDQGQTFQVEIITPAVKR